MTYSSRATIDVLPSNGAAVVFVVSCGLIALSLLSAITYFLSAINNIGFLAAAALLIGLCGLYGSLERAEYDIQSAHLGKGSTQGSR